MEIVRTENLASKFIPSFPAVKFNHKFLCTIGSCKHVCFRSEVAVKLPSFSCSSVRGRRLKPTRRPGVSSATKNNNDQPFSEEEKPQEKNESDTTGSLQNQDWRAFRAKLFAAEQINKSPKDESENASEADSCSVISVGSKWAHPLHEPEPGCVLIATEKLDGVENFERTAILLLRVDAEGPFGVILNRPLHRSVAHTRPTHPDIATVFSDCPLHYGGPVEKESMFLLAPEDKNAVSDPFEAVFPGLYYGVRDNLHHAAELVKSKVLLSQNFWFFKGYCSWDLDQLKKEIAFSGYWHVAACSPDLLTSAISGSSPDLWEEILKLMGDQYAELSRKPKQDSM